MLRAYGRLLIFAALVASAGCEPTVDLTRGITINIVKTGWYDVGIVNGQNKLVPSITFTVTNASDQKLRMLQINSLFRRVSEPDEWGSAMVTAAGSEGLAAGATTVPLTVKSNLGYTGSDQTRQEMLRNSHFVDAKVELFAKYGSIQWVRIGDYPISRELLPK
jgi:hypothetical protein